ncbi:MAG: hypothetical protein ACOCWR_04480 [Oceanidesulfovibrio sp.]
MIDYSATVDSLQKAFAEKCVETPEIVNQPGLSLVFKVDHIYAVGLAPGFIRNLAEWARVAPSQAYEAMLRTGNLVSRRNEDGRRESELNLLLTWESGGRRMDGRIRVSFFLADFLDRALALYVKRSALALSDLRIVAAEKDMVETFLAGKTAPQGLAYHSAS